MMSTKYIYCTLVFDNDEYVLGAITLAYSLRQTGTQYPIWCMYSNISKKSLLLLQKYFDNCVEVPIITQDAEMHTKKQRKIYGSWINKSFTKWNCMNPELFPVDKLLFLDADMIFKECPDDLFNLTTPACLFDSPYNKDCCKYGPTNYFKHDGSPYEHGAHAAKKHIKLCLERGWHGILGAIVLITPSKLLYNTFLEILSTYPKTRVEKPIYGPDEQVLGKCLLQLYDLYPPVHIHKKYAFHVGKVNWYNGNIIGQHYCSAHPWRSDRGSWDDVDEWYVLFDEICKESHDALLLHDKVRGTIDYSALDAS